MSLKVNPGKVVYIRREIFREGAEIPDGIMTDEMKKSMIDAGDVEDRKPTRSRKTVEPIEVEAE